MKKILITMLLVAGCMLSGCHYLDVVPDNLATIDQAFTTRAMAIKYLATCYSFLPNDGDMVDNPAFMAGDDVWCLYPPLNYDDNTFQIARGNQDVTSPKSNFWDGENHGKPLFRALRECNVFLDNIMQVPDMSLEEKKQWAAEVKFLKAYYHFYLMRMYGPIPIVDVNVPVDAPKDQVEVYRMPVDSVANYVCRLMDTAAAVLPLTVKSTTTDLGRITRPIALAMKAYVRVYAASPLFNGNADYAGFKDGKGTQLISPTYDKAKWDSAVSACKTAVDVCEQAGFSLYQFKQQFQTYDLSDETLITMSIRNAVTERWNSEVIWGNSGSPATSLQAFAQARLDPQYVSNEYIMSQSSPTLKAVEQFYSKHGVPIEEDQQYDYANRYTLRTATSDEKYDIHEDYTTVGLNFDREPRFYADLGFDGATWYGDGKLDDNDMWYVMARPGMPAARQQGSRYSVTGYWPKKLVYYQNLVQDVGSYNATPYPWPIMRLANLYLLYAEALNEAGGPSATVFTYLDKVRARAGLEGVQTSWTQYSRFPTKFSTQVGLRQIIHQERNIEMAFEGQRFWDLRRWKEAIVQQNQPVRGWDIDQEDPAAYYRQVVLFNQSFLTRDYLWPLKENDLTINRNLVQNPGW